MENAYAYAIFVALPLTVNVPLVVPSAAGALNAVTPAIDPSRSERTQTLHVQRLRDHGAHDPEELHTAVVIPLRLETQIDTE